VATFFGNNDSGTANTTLSAYTWWLVAGYACPNTGLQNVTTLDINIANIGDGTGHARLAIYTFAGAFVAQWDTEKVAAGTGWLVGTAFVDRAAAPINPVQLTGGASYLLVATGDYGVDNMKFYYDAVASGLAKLDFTDYTANFPATIPGGADNDTHEICIRCGVEPAGGGAAPGYEILKSDNPQVAMRRGGR